jgi:hypothetical protein
MAGLCGVERRNGGRESPVHSNEGLYRPIDALNQGLGHGTLPMRPVSIAHTGPGPLA